MLFGFAVGLGDAFCFHPGDDCFKFFHVTHLFYDGTLGWVQHASTPRVLIRQNCQQVGPLVFGANDAVCFEGASARCVHGCPHDEVGGCESILTGYVGQQFLDRSTDEQVDAFASVHELTIAPAAGTLASLQARNLPSRFRAASADLSDMDTLPIAERLECAVAQIGRRFAATGLPMHIGLQGCIDQALADWSIDTDDHEELKALVAVRITVPKKTNYVPVINLDRHTEPLERTDWPQSW